MSIVYEITPRGKTEVERWALSNEDVPLSVKIKVNEVIDQFIMHKIASGELDETQLSPGTWERLNSLPRLKPKPVPELKKTRFELIDVGSD